MNMLREEIYVNCPVNQALRYLNTFFSLHGRLALRAPLPVPGLRDGLFIHRDVSAMLKRVPAEGDAYDMFSVHWEAVGGGPFPRFNGTIEVKTEDDEQSFRLVLKGYYEPPLGVVGEAFDAVVGRWIAIATVRDLLERIRAAIESSYRTEEGRREERVRMSQ